MNNVNKAQAKGTTKKDKDIKSSCVLNEKESKKHLIWFFPGLKPLK